MAPGNPTGMAEGQKPKDAGDGGTRHLVVAPLGVWGGVTSPCCPSLPHSLKSRHPEAPQPSLAPG